jgi:hypothetical protein
MQTQHIFLADLKIGGWATSCYVVQPDYKRLMTSIETYGVLAPLVVQQGTNTIVDGHHRLRAAQELGLSSVPCVLVECDDIEAVLLHIDLNRYRGVVVAKFLSNLIGYILETGVYEYDALRERMALSKEEFDILADGTLVKMRKIKQHSYSPAWVPVESATGEDIGIERVTGHAEQV